MISISKKLKATSFALLIVLGWATNVSSAETEKQMPSSNGSMRNLESSPPVSSSKFIKRAERTAKAGYILAPTILAMSSLPYLSVLDNVEKDPAQYSAIIVPIVSGAALTNLIAAPIVYSHGKRVREQYGVSGDRTWRVAGWTLFVLSYLPVFSGPLGISYYLPPVCGLIGALGLLGLSLDAMASARQAKAKLGERAFANPKKMTLALAPSLSTITTKEKLTGFTFGVKGTF